jgi:RND family efflux transporter MFP subunit
MSHQTDNKHEGLEKRATDGRLMNVEKHPEVEAVSAQIAEVANAPPRSHNSSRARRKWLIRLGVLLAVALAVAFFMWRVGRPTLVTVVQPKLTTITETITSSGRVGGATETLVGAQGQGIVEQLYVKEGDLVAAGQRLAVLKNDVAEAQISQAEQAVRTARAKLAQTARGPMSSEVEAAVEQVRQAEAQVTQQRAAVVQAQKSVTQARAQINQLGAERDLAAKELARSRTLFEQGDVSRAEYDQKQTSLRIAEERVAAQQQAIALAQSSVRQAQAGLKSAEANLRVQQARLKTIESGARSEDVQVARQLLRDAEQAVRVARQQAGNAVVNAPFAGVVTQINTEMGQTVGAQGVLKLVSGEAEIRLDVDENNLADLKLGQSAVISSSAFSNSIFEGTVTEIGAAVNVARGTVQVTVRPPNPPEWLRPGQTVNVNIVTAKNVQRLLVPPTALTRAGDRTVVFVIENGVALEKPVVTRPPTQEGVPVLAGLSSNDKIIREVGNIKAGDAVRVKGKGNEQK